MPYFLAWRSAWSTFLTARKARILKFYCLGPKLYSIQYFYSTSEQTLRALFSLVLKTRSPIHLLPSSSMTPTATVCFPPDRNQPAPMLTRVYPADSNPSPLHAQTNAASIWVPGEVFSPPPSSLSLPLFPGYFSFHFLHADRSIFSLFISSSSPLDIFLFLSYTRIDLFLALPLILSSSPCCLFRFILFFSAWRPPQAPARTIEGCSHCRLIFSCSLRFFICT